MQTPASQGDWLAKLAMSEISPIQIKLNLAKLTHGQLSEPNQLEMQGFKHLAQANLA